MRTRIQVRGPATAEAMWAAYADTSRWAAWAPQIRRVEPLGPIAMGVRGEVEGVLGVKVRFEVTRFDETARRWTWRVRVGLAHMTIDHEVDDGVTAVVIEGPAPLVLAYAPVARLALTRLVGGRL
ncbi:MAG: SRPBCC family protein [Actinomycetota bacterium]